MFSLFTKIIFGQCGLENKDNITLKNIGDVQVGNCKYKDRKKFYSRTNVCILQDREENKITDTIQVINRWGICCWQFLNDTKIPERCLINWLSRVESYMKLSRLQGGGESLRITDPQDVVPQHQTKDSSNNYCTIVAVCLMLVSDTSGWCKFSALENIRIGTRQWKWRVAFTTQHRNQDCCHGTDVIETLELPRLSDLEGDSQGWKSSGGVAAVIASLIQFDQTDWKK